MNKTYPSIEDLKRDLVITQARVREVTMALSSYMRANEHVEAAMQDGINVQGALSALVGARDNALDILSDSETHSPADFDPSLIDRICCLLVEPVPKDDSSNTVTGAGIFRTGNNDHELIAILTRCELPWSHEVINRTYYAGYGHKEVMGWAVNVDIRDFLFITKPHRQQCRPELRDWFVEIGRYEHPIELRIMCVKKIWTTVDHLKGDYQKRAGAWATACFGEEAAINHFHRRNRFIEEAIELHQASGGTADEIIELVNHVYNKPTGDPHQEVGGTLVTLATLCNGLGVNLLHAGEDELARVWEEFPRIRAKQAAAIENSPLPGKLPGED